MKVYNDFQGDIPRGATVGIGNFDGVHRGHRRIIASLKEDSAEGGATGIITFTPHTRVQPGGGGQELLMTLEQRLEALAETGITFCCLCRFNRDLARMSPEDFAKNILGRKMKISGVSVGKGFRFGKNRSGTVATLTEIGDKAGFTVREVSPARIDGVEISSSLIRRLIKEGDMEEASRLLGRNYSLTGRVIHGRGEGKQWGYPTANFQPEQLPPAFGVYAAEIELEESSYGGILYLGTRPTFGPADDASPPAEAFLFDWDGELYGRKIKVSLKKRLRGDIRFNDAQLLLEQIGRDEKRARAILKG